MRFTGRLAQVNASPVPATAGRSIRRLGARGWIHTSPHFLCPRDRSQGRRELSGRVRPYEQHARAAHAEPFSALVIEAGDDDARSAASCDEDALGVAWTDIPGLITWGESRTQDKCDGTAHRPPAHPERTQERPERGDKSGEGCEPRARGAREDYRRADPDGEIGGERVEPTQHARRRGPARDRRGQRTQRTPHLPESVPRVLTQTTEDHRSILAAFRLRLGAVRALRWPPLTCHSVMSVARGSTLVRSRLRQLAVLILLSPFVCRFVVQAHRDAAVTAASTAAASEPRRMARHQSRNVVKS